MRDYYLISDKNLIAHWANSVTYDCLLRSIRSDTMTKSLIMWKAVSVFNYKVTA